MANTNTSPKAEKPTTHQQLMWIPISPERVDAWLSVVNVLMLVGGIFLAILAIMQFKLSAISDRYADARISANEAATAAANEGAALALQEVALAKERTAELENEGAQLRLALEKETAARMPRTITSEMEKSFMAALNGMPRGEVHIDAQWMNAEAEQFGKMLEQLLLKAGFTVTPSHREKRLLSFGSEGQFLYCKSITATPPHAAGLQKALKALGLYFPGVNNDALLSTDVTIGIGLKARIPLEEPK